VAWWTARCAADGSDAVNILRLPDFANVVANGTATLRIPRYLLTLCRIVLRLGGTFAKSNISAIRLKVGSRTVWSVEGQGATPGGTHLDRHNRYRGIFDQTTNITIDFTERDFMNVVVREIGGYDMSKLAEDLFLEVVISGATAPTLYALGQFTPPQGQGDDPDQLVQKLVGVPFSVAAGGRFYIPFEPRGCLTKRAYIHFNGTTGTATTNGNLQRLETRKNGITLFDPEDADNRFIQQEFRKVPQAQMFVMDYTFDNNASGALVTADAAALEFIAQFGALETGVAYFEVLDKPFNL
jgi:hypothetical protein